MHLSLETPVRGSKLVVVWFLTLFSLHALHTLHATTAVAEESIEVYRLVHSSAAEMITVLEPLVDEETRLSERDGQLIVSASSSEQARIAALLARLDTPPKQFLIMVRDGVSRAVAEMLLSERTVRRYATQQGTERSASLRVRSGVSAHVEEGQILRVVEALYADYWGGGLVEGEIAVSSGYTVTASARGDDSVALEIAPFSSRMATRGPTGRAGTSINADAADREVRDLRTSVVLPVDRWTLLGSTDSALDLDSVGRRAYSTAGSLSQTNTLVRVEAVD